MLRLCAWRAVLPGLPGSRAPPCGFRVPAHPASPSHSEPFIINCIRSASSELFPTFKTGAMEPGAVKTREIKIWEGQSWSRKNAHQSFFTLDDIFFDLAEAKIQYLA
ncbi:hypothetical protein QBC45DRAFT_429684 [Copromyces sp. CBS 386.78]|nr:hypothetical protein QBC45DRAFT_429684 [Copromyces sp. CBS 386.78]